jgi:hypothetical protein
MLFHPLIHFETSRQRQSEMLARAELYRLAKEARTGTQGNYGRLIEASAEQATAIDQDRPPSAGEFMNAPSTTGPAA